VIECEIDDMNPQIFGVVMEKLYAAGALEVFYVPVQMKKNRPGTLLTVVAAPQLRSAMSDIIFSETTTIGLRYSEVERDCLTREHVDVETPVGKVRMKLAWRDGRLVNAVPEFDDCARLAAAQKLPVKEVQALATKWWERKS
jgi:pyridinium-3,5-bisthiocarboxylic acid mononucleotide nickel chelatase